MPLGWLAGSKEASLAELIARKRYSKAIEVLRSQFRQGAREPRMRLQLADVLVMAGRPGEAAPILSGLADEFAREGFAGKAIAVLKKLERIAPGRPDVERRLAEMIHKRLGSTPAPGAPGAPGAQAEIGIEELGITIAPPPALSGEAGGTEAPASPSEEVFEEEFLEALHDVIDVAAPLAGSTESEARQGTVVRSPLFGDCSEEELAAMIARLRLLALDPGDIVVSEGQPGDSLFVLTTGTLKAFVRDRQGRNTLVREMPEGSFFGEVSLLSGRPRSATITCVSHCELLELDRAALGEIIAAHPHVRSVIQETFAARRGSEEELKARAGTEARS